MLSDLIVRNYALIDNLHMEFERGFNVLTGETGAGKSILIGALGVILGNRVDTSTMRSGAEEMLVSGSVTVEGNDEAKKWLGEHGIEIEDGKVILRRSIKKNGRSVIYIQSVPVTRSDLSAFTSLIFDLHGQHEHQSLLKTENHRKLLDRFGRNEELVIRYSRVFKELSELRERYSRLLKNEMDRNRKIELLQYSINEIESAALREGEEEELTEELKVLSNYEKLFGLVEAAYGNISENKNGALAYLRSARGELTQASDIDKNLVGIARELEDSFYTLEEIAEKIRDYRENIQFDPERLSVAEERLSLIRSLEKKYGRTIGEVLGYLEMAKRELEDLENWEDEKVTLEKSIAGKEAELRQLAGELSEKRKRAASIIEKKIESELKDLGMQNVRFKVTVEERKGEKGNIIYGSHGKDSVEFLISPNKGEPFKKLKNIASGGEVSRVMLAIKTILAESDNIDTLVFDEIDVGIGGEVAISVGEKLKNIASRKQVLCITHLATIAVQADNHIKVEKVVRNGRTVTEVKNVKGDERVKEIARMLAGDKETSTSLKYAGELLAKYAKNEKHL